MNFFVDILIYYGILLFLVGLYLIGLYMVRKKTRQEIENILEKENKQSVSASFEMEGKVFFVERDKHGNVISEEEIDGEIVLKLLVWALEIGIDMVNGNYNKKRKVI